MDLSFIFLACLQSKHYPCWSTSFSPIFGAGYHQLTCLGLWTSWLCFPAVLFLVLIWLWPLIFFQGLSLSPLVFFFLHDLSPTVGSSAHPRLAHSHLSPKISIPAVNRLCLWPNPSCLLEDHPPASIPSLPTLSPQFSASSSPIFQEICLRLP